MEILYRADDGTIFTDQYECENYENTLNHENLYTIEFIDKDNVLYLIDKNFITDEDVYDGAEAVVIHDKDELKDFQWLAEYCGWYEWYDITEPGTWKRIETEPYHEGKWVKVEVTYE